MKDQSFILCRGPRSFTALMGFLSALPTDKEFQVTIGAVKKERTLQQNKALFGCAYAHLRKATGNDKEDLHEYFCGEYFGWEESKVMGKKKLKPKRTTTTGYDGERDVISTADLQDFYAFIQQRSAEHCYYVPDPDPRWFLYEESKAA